jgi:predicted RNase H-like HicB family nuclease
MFSDFVYQKLRTAHYKLLGDGTYFGEIPDCAGVWASGDNLEICREELHEVLEEWILLKI